VKILDFGLAKLMETTVATANEVTVAGPDRTDAGLVVGTVGYKSPEQAEGAALDSRSDIFSFGVLLYEMVTGRKPFTGTTPMQTISAILRDTPKPIAEVAPGCPRELERVIDRCLRKDPARRWQHMDDVRIALLELKEESDSGRLGSVVEQRTVRVRRRWWPIGATAAALALAAILFVQMRPPERPGASELTPVPLTTFPGDERDPTFSPDGTQVAFSWGPEAGVTNTYVKLIGPGEPIRLTNSAQSERQAQWSPDGRWVAFGRRLPFPDSDFVIVPALGGPERVVTRAATVYCFWTPDSQSLLVADGSPAALYMWPLDGSEKKLVVAPPTGASTIGGSISPDGKLLAVSFVRNGRRPLYVVPLGDGYQAAGSPRAMTPLDWDVASWAWTPDSKEIAFIRVVTGSNLGGITGMYRVRAAGGPPQRLDFAGDNPWFLDISRRGNRLAYTRLQRDVNVYAATLAPDGTLMSAGDSVASSSRRDIDAAFSPDGERVVLSSDREGSSEIWMASKDGRNPRALTSAGRAGVFDGGGYPQWSPDGTQIVYTSRVSGEGSEDVFVVSAAGGAPRRVTDDVAMDTGPSWSMDGSSIHFLSGRDGATRVWTVPAAGGTPRRLSATVAALSAPLESPDGRWVYFRRGGELRRIARDGTGEQVIVKEGVSLFRPTSRGVYYLSRATDLLSAELRLVPLGGGASRTLGTIPHYVAGTVSISPDFTRVLYARCDQCAADIMLVENFR
jgi:Tol biopolymer transport system component